MAAGVPGVTVTSAAQAGTSSANRRRAVLNGPNVDLSKAVAFRVRAIIAGGGIASSIQQLEFANDHVNRGGAGVYLEKFTSPAAPVPGFGRHASGAPLSNLVWLNAPVRHDITLWGTIEDRRVFIGAGEQVASAREFAVADLDRGSCFPFVSFSTNANTVVTSYVLNRFEFDVFCE